MHPFNAQIQAKNINNNKMWNVKDALCINHQFGIKFGQLQSCWVHSESCNLSCHAPPPKKKILGGAKNTFLYSPPRVEYERHCNLN